MILGIGTDIVEIERMSKLLQGDAGQRFLSRVLSERELELAASKQARLAEFAAGRFAAKEAVAKAFGCGIGSSLSFRDIEIMPDASGKPTCSISPDAGIRRRHAAFRVHISISHSKAYATAMALVEQDDPRST